MLGLPRTGTTSVSAALLDYDLKVAHTAFTKRAFELADVISDAPCFCDYKELDALFPDSKFVYLERSLEKWIPSIQMLLTKMLPELEKNGYLHPVLKRAFHNTFLLTDKNCLDEAHLAQCYFRHQAAVENYFNNRSDLLKVDVSHVHSFKTLLDFIGVQESHYISLPHFTTSFPHLNIGKQVDNWRQLKHANKVNPLAAGKEHRKFFDYI